MKKKYEVKIAYKLFVAIYLFVIAIPFVVFVMNGFSDELFIIMLVIHITFAIISHLFLNTEYSIQNNILSIKCRFLFHKKIDIHEIKSIKKTNSLQSSPAPSFDRIEIKYGKFEEIILSPKDKFTFVKDVLFINKAIENNIVEN